MLRGEGGASSSVGVGGGTSSVGVGGGHVKLRGRIGKMFVT